MHAKSNSTLSRDTGSNTLGTPDLDRRAFGPLRVIFAIFLFSTAGAAFGADVFVGSAQIDFAMKSAQAVTLSVGGPEGFSFKREFAAGEPLHDLSHVDPGGG